MTAVEQARQRRLAGRHAGVVEDQRSRSRVRAGRRNWATAACDRPRRLSRFSKRNGPGNRRGRTCPRRTRRTGRVAEAGEACRRTAGVAEAWAARCWLPSTAHQCRRRAALPRSLRPVRRLPRSRWPRRCRRRSGRPTSPFVRACSRNRPDPMRHHDHRRRQRRAAHPYRPHLIRSRLKVPCYPEHRQRWRAQGI